MEEEEDKDKKEEIYYNEDYNEEHMPFWQGAIIFVIFLVSIWPILEIISWLFSWKGIPF